MSWSTANHEVIPGQEFLLPAGTMHPYLWAFLQSDGETFKESVDDYAGLRKNLAIAIERFHGRSVRGKAPTDEVKASRLRTWKPLFERAGLLMVNSRGVLEVSPFGHAVRDLFDDVTNRIAGANEHLAQWATTVLSRYPLLNPLEGPNGGNGLYPSDSDLLPFQAIWQAARQLGDRLHWEELNRGLMLIHHQRDLQGVIDSISEARRAGGESYFDDPKKWLGSTVAVEDGNQTRRRVTPWLSRASFGGLLAEDDEISGLWTLREDRISLIDDALREPICVPVEVRSDRASFVKWLSSPISRKRSGMPNEVDSELIRAGKEACRKFGHSTIICLSGMPGTGKSRLARMIADELTESDPYRSMEIQFHEGTSYEDFVEGFVPKPDGTGFQLTHKTLRTICRRASSDPQNRNYVLLIEEFTRANTHAVLGELLTYIEHRGRRFRYSLSQNEDSIPANLIVIATLNPRDRSATQLDSAIRRRMHYLDIAPSTAALVSMLEARVLPETLSRLSRWYERWSTSLPFGHGIFANAKDEEDLEDIWKGTCLRLLEDTFGEIDSIYAQAAEEFPCQSNS
ncbi:AAA family ATPase [Stenotrophomonas rhizophila]|uniref:McrB family protein n=1 Tax=Stenotrophomonas rhizophila TaxID=216778 RepID=UPI00224AF0A2|nr:AAA family ATPase [Stenotrophomonas rhizophila]MCX2921512.1 AAA family ATPase [Stenotrophomonas rhizophila]